MNWLEIAWTMMAAASLTLGLVHLLVWSKQRLRLAHLAFFVLAAAVAAFSAFELMVMRAQSPSAYAAAVRWAHVPLTLIVLSIIAFVYLYFGTGRLWLAYAAAAFRLLALLLNFVTGVNVNFEDVTALQHVTLWGGAVVTVPVGTLNPWLIVAQIGNLLLVGFVVDATIALWRRGDPVSRRRAVLVGGGIALCLVVVITSALLILGGAVRAPTILTPGFLIVVMAMGYELSWDLVAATQLSNELRESERRIDLAAQAAELAFWSWDVARDEIWITAKGRVLFEFDEAEPIDLAGLLSRVHPDDRDTLRRAISEAGRGGGVIEQEFRLVLAGGEFRWIVARGQVEQGKGAGHELLRGVWLDITVRRQLEQDAAQQRNELAHLSRVATLGELSGSLAHEINQPLMGILSNAQAAQRFLAGDNPNLVEVREILADIVEDDKRAGEVIRRLRALLKKGEVQHGPLDINNVVDDVLRLTRNDLMNRDVMATAEQTSDLPPVLGDRIQIQQVLLNMVVNACDAMEGIPGTRRVLIRTRRANGAGVEISVSDQGGGIPAADLDRIFQPFVSTKKHGMGLGLSVCRTIVLAHGGALWAENNSGPGATVRFTLPVAGDAE